MVRSSARLICLVRARDVALKPDFAEAFEFTQGVASIVERVGIAGLEGDRLVKARQRLVEALEFTQGIASVAKGASVS